MLLVRFPVNSRLLVAKFWGEPKATCRPSTGRDSAPPTPVLFRGQLYLGFPWVDKNPHYSYVHCYSLIALHFALLPKLQVICDLSSSSDLINRQFLCISCPTSLSNLFHFFHPIIVLYQSSIISSPQLPLCLPHSDPLVTSHHTWDGAQTPQRDQKAPCLSLFSFLSAGFSMKSHTLARPSPWQWCSLMEA